jgi:hypothetical protein
MFDEGLLKTVFYASIAVAMLAGYGVFRLLEWAFTTYGG